jgi:general secretion pathway protein L
MNNAAYLIIWLADPAASQFEWRMLDADFHIITGSHSLEQTALPLSELAQKAEEVDVIVLTPSQKVVLTKTTLTARNRAQLLQALPYALEEELASDVEELHFAIAPVVSSTATQVAIVAHQDMRAWLDILQTAGIEPVAMLPELLAMPVMEAPTLLLTQTQVYIRSQSVNCCLDLPHLANSLSLLPPVSVSNGMSIIFSHAQQALVEQMLQTHGLSAHLQAQENSPLDYWATELRFPVAINLLQGRYAVKQKSSRLQRLRQTALILGGTWLGLSFLTLVIEYGMLRHVVNKRNTEISALYHQAFPSAASDLSRTEMRTMVNREQQQLKQAATEDKAIQLIRHVAMTLSSMPKMVLRDFSFQDKTLTLTIQAPDFAALQAFTHVLMQRGLTVVANDATRQDTHVVAQVVISG